MEKSLLIIAVSARPFVVAAVQAGYVVTAIDAFADKQTVELAETTIVVSYDKHGLKAEELLRVIGKLDASQYLGFAYGSGFEAQPALLQDIANIIPLIGNTATTVQAVKTASSFFTALDLCDIAYPRTCYKLPFVFSECYLQKFAGGCGGAHIKKVIDHDAKLGINHYYQQQIDGRSISLLFIANSCNIETIGFNEQWTYPAETMPFRYGGAVSHIDLPSAVQQQLIYAAEQLTRAFGLLGLNSLDAIVQDDIVYVLEINPRLSATFDLYLADFYQNVGVNIMDLHIQASLEGEKFQHCNVKKSIQIASQPKAHAIVYAPVDVVISASFEWPNWVVDSPYLAKQDYEIQILAGEPVCSILAHADDAGIAKHLVEARVKVIMNLLENNIKKGVYATL